MNGRQIIAMGKLFSLNRGERGHIMVALMVAITILTVFLTVGAEKWSTILRRDREVELVFRGMQYAQGLAAYQQEHGALPTDVEMLIKKGPKGHRYIRQLFPEPFSKDGKWAYLYLAPGGQAVVNPLTQEMRPISALQQHPGKGMGVGQPIGPQTPQDFGLRAQRRSTNFPGRGQQPAPPGDSLIRASVTQISPFPMEQIVGGPIAGVVSPNLKEKAFTVFEGYERVREFWFTIFKFSPGPGPASGGGQGPIPGGIGPGQRVMDRRGGRGGFGGSQVPRR